MKTETPKTRRRPHRPTRWQWGTDRNGRACIVLNNGVTREALAWDEGEGEWAGLGKDVRAYAVTGLWRPIHMMPIAFQDDAGITESGPRRPLKLIKVGVFPPDEGSRTYMAYTYWYNPQWPRCCEHEVEAFNGTEAKKIAIREHKERCEKD